MSANGPQSGARIQNHEQVRYPVTLRTKRTRKNSPQKPMPPAVAVALLSPIDVSFRDSRILGLLAGDKRNGRLSALSRLYGSRPRPVAGDLRVMPITGYPAVYFFATKNPATKPARKTGMKSSASIVLFLSQLVSPETYSLTAFLTSPSSRTLSATFFAARIPSG